MTLSWQAARSLTGVDPSLHCWSSIFGCFGTSIARQARVTATSFCGGLLTWVTSAALVGAGFFFARAVCWALAPSLAPRMRRQGRAYRPWSPAEQTAKNAPHPEYWLRLRSAQPQSWPEPFPRLAFLLFCPYLFFESPHPLDMGTTCPIFSVSPEQGDRSAEYGKIGRTRPLSPTLVIFEILTLDVLTRRHKFSRVLRKAA
jgi:hypothetical protein